MSAVFWLAIYDVLVDSITNPKKNKPITPIIEEKEPVLNLPKRRSSRIQSKYNFNSSSAPLIDYNETLLIDKLKILGVEIDTLTHNQEFFVETYTVSEYKRANKKYEKMNLQTIKTEISSQNIQFPKGTFKISMKQKRSNIVAEVLEPEAPNSFVSFGVLKTEKNQRLPIYRISN